MHDAMVHPGHGSIGTPKCLLLLAVFFKYQVTVWQNTLITCLPYPKCCIHVNGYYYSVVRLGIYSWMGKAEVQFGGNNCCWGGYISRRGGLARE